MNNVLKIDFEDIKEEVEYWEHAVVASVLGCNPPISVEGYFKRIWGKWEIDRVASLKKGIFIVRFHTMENRKKVLEDEHQLFDKKPLIVQPWCSNMDIRKTDVEKVPILVRMPGLDIKFWGHVSLMKIAGIIGKPLKADRATTEKELLNFARVMVEVPLKKDLPDVIEFFDEWGYKVLQEFKYEWKPIHCTNCGGTGHDTEKCKRLLGTRKEWMPKKHTATVQAQTDEEGFVTPRVTQSGSNSQVATPVSTTNPFQALNVLDPLPVTMTEAPLPVAAEKTHETAVNLMELPTNTFTF